MDLLLRFKDPARYELRSAALALARLCRSVAEGRPGTEKHFLRFFSGLSAAKRAPGRAALLAAFENAGALLERVRLDMENHGLKPGPEAAEALLFTERALRKQADFISDPYSGEALAEAARDTAAASRSLALASLAANSDGREFIANLKFSRIYSGLERTVRAAADCARLLANTPLT